MKIHDVTKCLEEIELLGKAYEKAKSFCGQRRCTPSGDEDAEKNEEDSEYSTDDDEDEDRVSAATFLRRNQTFLLGRVTNFSKRWMMKIEDSEDSKDDEDWDIGST
ncbi:Eukaryotic translation initiation factor 3 subunit C [Plecturocebus cupreus]